MGMPKHHIFRRRIWAALAIMTLTTTFSASTAFSMTVSDPTSYVYYVEQIKALTEQIEQYEEQVTEQKNTVEGVKEIYDQLKGIYDTGKDLYDDVRDAHNKIKSNPKQAIYDYASQIVVKDADGNELDIDPNDPQGTTLLLLDSIFRDARDVNGYGYPNRTEREHIQQMALKDAITDSDAKLAETEKNLESLMEILQEIDDEQSNPTTKSAVDWNTRMLGEIHKTLNQMLWLMSKHFFAQDLHLYKGASMETHKEVLDTVDASPTREARSEQYYSTILSDMENFYKDSSK